MKVSKFNKGDRVRVRLASHSPYRGQIGVVDDDPTSYPHPSSGSVSLWYTVRFDYRGLHPAISLIEEDLEAVTDEITSEGASATVKLDLPSGRKTNEQVSRVKSKRLYFVTAIVSALILTGVLIGINITGGENNSGAAPEFSSTGADIPLINQVSSNETVRLVFSTELAGATAGSAFPVQPTVKVVDASGDTVTDYSGPVTIFVTNNRATLHGTTTADAVEGVATFTDLSINLAGLNYSLTAISRGVTSSISNSFSVEPGAGVRLYFIAQPAPSGLPSRFTAKVAVADAHGNLDTNSNAEVSINITPGSGPAGAVLSGTTVQSVRDGLANFDFLSVNPENYSYRLTASSPGLASATSQSFNLAQMTQSQASQ